METLAFILPTPPFTESIKPVKSKAEEGKKKHLRIGRDKSWSRDPGGGGWGGLRHNGVAGKIYLSALKRVKDELMDNPFSHKLASHI